MAIMKPYAPLPESLVRGKQSARLGRLHRWGWGGRTGLALSAKELAFVEARKSLAGEAGEASCEGEGSCEPF